MNPLLGAARHLHLAFEGAQCTCGLALMHGFGLFCSGLRRLPAFILSPEYRMATCKAI